MYISKEFKFDSAHQLVEYNGKCENLHGHTYKLRVTLKGEVDEKSGMIIDFTILKKIVNENIIERLDHTYLNNIVKQPTAENIVRWIWDELYPLFKTDKYQLYELILWETEDSFVCLRDE
ncbi:MAG: 6-carboxytetrahydropterin synthase QueD [Brevinematales bacterium]|nr:6-carboxytetrahydropterin synthase QueD [Brevinematales bacterium]